MQQGETKPCSCCDHGHSHDESENKSCTQHHHHKRPVKATSMLESGDVVVFHCRIIKDGQVVEDSFALDKPISIVLGKEQVRFTEIENRFREMNIGECNELSITRGGNTFAILLKILRVMQKKNESDEWLPIDEERYNVAMSKKEEGNVYFAQSKFISATRLYRHAITQIRKIDKRKWDHHDRKTRDLLITLFNNLLTCELKLKRFSNVVKFSTECIENVGANVKSYFKRGEAHMNDGNFEMAKMDFTSAKELLLTVDQNADVHAISKIISGSPKSNITDSVDHYKKMLQLIESTLSKCIKMEAEHNKTMKSMFKNIF